MVVNLCLTDILFCIRFDVTSDEAEVIIQLSQKENKSTVLARFDMDMNKLLLIIKIKDWV